MSVLALALLTDSLVLHLCQEPRAPQYVQVVLFSSQILDQKKIFWLCVRKV